MNMTRRTQVGANSISFALRLAWSVNRKLAFTAGMGSNRRRTVGQPRDGL